MSLEIAQEIKIQLSYNQAARDIFWSWGASNFTALNRSDLILGGLRFKVRGKLLKGLVEVRLMPSDTYEVVFYKGITKPKEVKRYKDIYCEDLLICIDEVVESETNKIGLAL